MIQLDNPVFNMSPIPLWLEDFSAVKLQLQSWRAQGIQDLREYLQNNPLEVEQSARKINILQVNPQTLKLYEASNLEELRENLKHIFREDMLHTHVEELVHLWEGRTQFTNTAVNYTLSGERLDIQLRCAILPEYLHDWSQVLITTENITPFQNARRLEEKNRMLAEARFVYSPTSLWVEDFSSIKKRLDQLRAIGIEDFNTFLDVHPDFIQQCIKDIVIIDVNQATLDLFGAADKSILLKNTHKIFSNEMSQTFRQQLLDLWEGKTRHQHEAVNYALDGSIRHVLLQFTVFPGAEQTWDTVQVALVDITARKKAENYLEYLGKHDALTKLYNRIFYIDEVNRLERSMQRPVSCIFIDLNGLKNINDQFGHDAGDELLRRMGHVLEQLIKNTQYSASRIGGYEFVILLPNADLTSLNNCLHSLNELMLIDNQFHAAHPISLSIGHACSQPNERLEDTLKRADAVMYHQKRAYYAAQQ
ncbi:sensor domain-containing diguanylate cyclase [Acinetobacter tianfuensis]|uniref:Sensor domain-containing diguanylate cyclase n=1 Tax=Acinetobacter tianfuensis TaxID=2419603 RepID=A0A3A8EIB7_9GAMM|nr:sensor domain-containing diguanylate cyclase [Acinetobacter tianfuensis]RKG34687.1 sensor domain-containing diguanylate cyclase [Acinetobacter tianfuensis]